MGLRFDRLPEAVARGGDEADGRERCVRLVRVRARVRVALGLGLGLGLGLELGLGLGAGLGFESGACTGSSLAISHAFSSAGWMIQSPPAAALV